MRRKNELMMATNHAADYAIIGSLLLLTQHNGHGKRTHNIYLRFANVFFSFPSLVVVRIWMPLPINCICQFAYLHKFLAALIPSFSILIPTCIHFAPSTCVSDTRYHHFSHMHRFEVHALRVDACMRIPSISFTFMANYIVCAVPHPTRQ